MKTLSLFLIFILILFSVSGTKESDIQEECETPIKIGSTIKLNNKTNQFTERTSVDYLYDDLYITAWDGFVGGQNMFLGQIARIKDADKKTKIIEKVGDEVVLSEKDKYISGGKVVSLEGEFFLAVWQENFSEQDIDYLHGQLYKVSSTNGYQIEKVGEKIKLSDDTEFSSSDPCVCCVSDKEFVVGWQSPKRDGSGEGIYSRIFQFNKEENEIIGSEDVLQVNNHTTNDQRNCYCSKMNNENKYVIVWESNTQDSSGYGIYGQVFSFDNLDVKKIDKEFQANTITYGDQHNPVVVNVNNDNGFIVGWSSVNYSADGLTNLYSQTFKMDENSNLVEKVGKQNPVYDRNEDGAVQGQQLNLHMASSLLNNKVVFAFLIIDDFNTIYLQNFNVPNDGQPEKMGNALKCDGDKESSVEFPALARNEDSQFIVSYHQHNASESSVPILMKAYDIMNQAPYLNNAIKDDSLSYGKEKTISIEKSTFLDPEDSEIDYTMTLSNGDKLPSWCEFNPDTLEFKLSPDKSIEFDSKNDTSKVFTFTLTATDPCENSASSDFKYTINFNEDKGLSKGAKIAIGVLVPLFVIILVILIVILYRKKKKKKETRETKVKEIFEMNSIDEIEETLL
ncbi:hypothetical protein M0813_05356 [Anaeramoeba flamelloides]|uniref:Dystroglycan-type cadherin-like domain-containing protein n=1 Tax=Anaeramoeba flamelloides TaxID=1746091 RepID=A0ABQ8XHR4_9EUKA|nr:hypothetical protein M0813_05356 [Anaeramoeba flamelloides]